MNISRTEDHEIRSQLLRVFTYSFPLLCKLYEVRAKVRADWEFLCSALSALRQEIPCRALVATYSNKSYC